MPRKFLLWSKTHFLPCRKNSFLEDFLMQHTYCISNATPILSYLQCFINIFRADFERSANMPKLPLINYHPLCPLLHKTPKKPHLLCLISLVSYSEFHLNPTCTFYSSNRHKVQSTHEFFFKKTPFRTPGTSKREGSSKSQH